MNHYSSLVSIVPYQYFLWAALVFAVIVAGMLLFIFAVLQNSGRRRKAKQQLQSLFSDLIAEISLAETADDLEISLQQFGNEAGCKKLLTKPFARKVLIKELVKAKENISGKSAGNLCWLYEQLGLDKESFEQFQKKDWHRKAKAIQYLAEMKQAKYLVKIYRETNNKNHFIRTEAQLAVVKLTGFKGLRFLDIVSYPVSEWQQLSLINQLQEGETEAEKIKGWLLSKNDTVVQFALRLVEVYNCYGLHNDVVACLHNPSITVRLQALQALKEINNETTATALLQHFPMSSRQEQLFVLDLLNETDAGSQVVSFLSSLLPNPDSAICFHAMQAIQRLSPNCSSVAVKEMKDHPQFEHLFSSLHKKAV